MRRTSTRRGAEDERRILVIANETVGGEALREAITQRAEGVARRCSSSVPRSTRRCATGPPTRTAHAPRPSSGSTAASPSCDALGIDARGEVGDGEPLQAIEDAMRTFGADEIVISTHPEGRSHWLERGVVVPGARALRRSVTHVVVDLEAEREEVG